MVTFAQSINIDLWAVVVAAAAAYGFSAIWYSPVLFGNEWQKMTLATYKSLKPSAMKEMSVTALIGSGFAYMIMAYVLAFLMSLVEVGNATDAVALAAWIGFGFVLTQSLVHALYHNVRRKLWTLNAAHEVAVLLIMGFILGTWL